jgi:PIF1-like helicase
MISLPDQSSTIKYLNTMFGKPKPKKTKTFRLWNTFKTRLYDDFYHQFRTNNIRYIESDLENLALNEINEFLCNMNKSLADFNGMPQIILNNDSQPRIIQLEKMYNIQELKRFLNLNVPLLTMEQQVVYDTTLKAALSTAFNNKVFFIDGPGGSGKTFVYNCIINKIRASGFIALAVASSGIAALLLDGGTTAHSRFQIPLDINEKSMCKISKQSDLAQLIRLCKVIVWDEAPMMNKLTFEAVDRTFRDLMEQVDERYKNLLFGGKCLVFGGDFRQIPPVIRHGNRAAIVSASLKRSYIWQHVQTLQLKKNLRIRTGPNSVQFNTLLMEIGEDRALRIWDAANVNSRDRIL